MKDREKLLETLRLVRNLLLIAGTLRLAGDMARELWALRDYKKTKWDAPQAQEGSSGRKFRKRDT